MILSIFENISQSLFWPFSLAQDLVESENYIHFPLIYSTNIYLELECYARAMLRFAEDNSQASALNLKLIDDCVVSFDKYSLPDFITSSLDEALRSEELANKLIKQSITIQQLIPSECFWLEQNIASRSDAFFSTFSALYLRLVDLMALNQYNIFYETAFVYLNENFKDEVLFETLKKRYFEKKSFSHLAYFSSQVARLTTRARPDCNDLILQDFYWNSAFLQNSNLSDQTSPKSEINFINKKLNTTFTLAQILKADSRYLTVPKDLMAMTAFFSELSGFESSIHRILYTMKALEITEEVRHYWQARFFRLVRIVLNDTKKIEETSFQNSRGILSGNS
ncbi:hypothetical protein SNE25_19700 [Mucilaginibacter sabulilitoris]|uniref:Uncharacterized protein n=1 Tax=Mucilaginibacter sabulilitoris TaxID=1173583 RepID=A0ABZ0TFG9_9SPHI|nr:hypothetical protein [Mucilaginibacter sabulilitoris]WPU91546.1 hypothetical protein SNE25_19700 [Mucilaginibacter sabulilitoris]